MGSLLTLIGLAFAWKLFKMFVEFLKKNVTVEERPYEVQTITEEDLATQSTTPESVEYYPESQILDIIGVEGGGGYKPPHHSIMDEEDLEVESLGGDENSHGDVNVSFIHEAIQHDLKKAIILKEILDRKY